MSRKIKKNETKEQLEANINSLSHEGRGIAHINNKITFIENALPDEKVKFIYTKRHSKFNSGIATEVLEPSPHRVMPACKHSEVCGGCNLQHLEHSEQISFKTKVVLEQLQHIGKIETENVLPPITGPTIGYRNKARLSAKYVTKKQKLLIGFHEKKGRYIAEITSCKVLNPKIGKKINELSELIQSLSIYQHIPQIEVACGDKVVALIIRHLQSFSTKDLNLINAFATKHQFQIYSQSGGPDTVKPITANPQPLSYKLLDGKIEIFFAPTDFTQINSTTNRKLVDHVIDSLEIKPDDNILDLFCGIGNFTLPIAAQCELVIGVEGSKNAVLHAKQNAKHNTINNAEFYTADLTKELVDREWSTKKYNKIILDPPRTGALEICEQIKKFGAEKIVYVSCNPATFARDAKVLSDQGYQLQNITIADMYPHTKHVELISCFKF